LPIQKNKWAFAFEPTYQKFTGQKTIEGVSVVIGGQLVSEVDYSSIELPLTLRHYFLLDNNSKLFADVSVVFDSPIASTLEFGNSITGFKRLKLVSSESFAAGVGYKHKNKYSIQLQHQFGRDLLVNEFVRDGKLNWFSTYTTSSLIFGYTLF
jgi:hypothetical protein